LKNIKKIQQSSSIFIRFFRYLSPILRKESSHVISSLVALFVVVFLKVLQPWPLKFIIDSFFLDDPLKGSPILQIIGEIDNFTLIIGSAIALVIIIGLRALAQYYSMVGFAKIGSHVLTKVRNMLFRHIQVLSLSFHSKARSGDLILRVMNDIGQLKQMSSTAFLPLVGNVLVFVVIIAVMFLVNWQLSLIALTIIPLFFLFSISKGKKIQKLARQQKKREGAMGTTASESFVAIKEIQALSLKDTFIDKFSGQSNESLKQDVKIKKEQAGLIGRVDVLIGLATAMILGYGALLVLDDVITPGDLILFLFYVNSAFRPLRNFSKYVGRISRVSASCERVLEVLEQKPEVIDLPNATKAQNFKGEIRLEDVSFAYQNGFPILENINLTIPACSKVALVGSSGTGKSTIVSLILRLYDPTQGRITIDGQDIRKFTLDSLRAQINVVQQDNMLFGVSVAENIAYGASVNENISSIELTQEEIESAARLANAHEFIKLLPEGYETIIGERGATLSRGQRQRIAIARAAIRKTSILILDEPNTGLDEKNERLLVLSMEKLAHNSTTFLVTHNLKHAASSDLILYLEDGHIVESGTHSELMKINGRYASLFKLQVMVQDNK